MLHGLHPALRRRLHDRVDLLDLPLPDQVPDGVVREEDLEACDAAGPVRGGQQRLGDDALERVRELHAHLLLLGRREDVDDAVDRRRGALRVQRREDQVARLGGGQRGADGLEVAHLAEEDHVRVLAQRRAQRLGEGRSVLADLALGDDAALVPVHELDRVLDGENVMGLRAVDLVDHRGERGRLPGAGRAGDEDEAARLHREVAERLRQAELLERSQLGGNVPEAAASVPRWKWTFTRKRPSPGRRGRSRAGAIPRAASAARSRGCGRGACASRRSSGTPCPRARRLRRAREWQAERPARGGDPKHRPPPRAPAGRRSRSAARP